MKYLPCPNLQVSIQQNVLCLEGPSVFLEVDFNPSDVSIIESFVASIQENKHTPAVDWVFARLARYPVCFILPRKSRGKRAADALLDFARKPLLPFYDALSLFSRLRIQMRSPASTLFSERCEALLGFHESEFLAFARFYIRQNHYVTSRALECLQPALGYKPFSPLLDDFIASERGHDKLMWQSLQALGVNDASEVEVLPEVEELMFLLKYAAVHCRLAFVLFIELLENESPAGEHPLAVQLAKTEKGKAAAWGLARHTAINNSAQHDEIAFSLARLMPAVNRSTAMSTIHLVEQGVRLRDGIREKMLKLLDAGIEISRI